MEDPPFIGDWHFVKKLGSGGFGLVKLWQNRKTGQNIGKMEHYTEFCKKSSDVQRTKKF